MGVPKFFRYMSERYPCLSESVREYQIPEFDNLYLDMNGIIHNCSHPDDGNPHFRITQEKIFADIFHYIEILFSMIKPQKVFFMAIDGVAPRAKMNQQRGRRFRTAKDAEKQEKEAVKRGEVLPKEARFDSNCITPGTEFMVNLHEQLKYFVVRKVSQDPLWQRCEIILSGHETPGEGEHKIMDFIRYKRSQADYDPNTRHCLYGLDADLIMLGLCTHDPNFSLLREEVKFGKKNSKKNCVPDEIRFFLLHLSLMREYIELEFAPLKDTLKDFQFDIEKIIDDWVLMGFLVGNDFIPNLPDLHINKGALPILYKVYMDILPQLDGYINEGGILNLKRFEIFMKKLGERDLKNFEEVREDLLYMEAKTGRKCQPFHKNNTKLRDLESWKPDDDDVILRPEFLTPLTDDKPKDAGLSALIAATEKEYLDDEDADSNVSDEDEEEDFENYKRNYYMNKLEYVNVTPEVMKSQAEGYVRAIQWNLHYYYNGVCSWSWYYPHHYAPYISDIKCFQNLKLEYQLGKPFMPYEQLLAVLPSASKNLLPKCFQKLMTDNDSPIKKYYPEEFDTDLNGKMQEWEAVVLVPFIDEGTLLEAMKGCENEMSHDEAERNKHGPMLVYSYTEDSLGLYKAPMYFPTVTNNHAKVKEMRIEDLRVPVEKLIKGAHPKASNEYCYGFPTFKHLQYRGVLKRAKVKVFELSSRGDNMIVQVIPSEKVLDAKIPLDLLGKIVFVSWPHLLEAKVVAVYNSESKYVYVGEGVDPVLEPSGSTFNSDVNVIKEYYNTRLGIEFGEVKVMVKVQTLIGQKYMFAPTGRVSLEKTFCKNTSNYPLQLIVENVNVVKQNRPEINTLDEAFPINSTCFAMTKNEYYGLKAIVQKDEKTEEGKVCVSVNISDEPDLSKIKSISETIGLKYRKLYHATAQLNMSSNVFSRVTGCFFVSAKNKEGGLKNVNLGLELKNNKKNLETPEYTKKIDGLWYYTDAAIDVVAEYSKLFPEIIQHLYKNHHYKDLISIEDIFQDDSDTKLKEVQTWLKSQPFYQIEKRLCNSTVLDKEIVEEIEKIVDSYKPMNTKNVVLYCKPYLLYKPELHFGNLVPDLSVKVELFDRIVHVRANHTVPLGLKGTVIGIHKGTSDDPKEHTFDILFDTEFEGGNELNCSNGRGFRLPLKAFINISHGIRMYRLDNSSEMRKDENMKYQNQNRGYHNMPKSNSAFVKFNSKPFLHNSQVSYNAVPPYMLNGDPIYKSYNPVQAMRQTNYNNQNVPREGGAPQENFDYRNPFQKTYKSDSYQRARCDNSVKQKTDPEVEQNTNFLKGLLCKSEDKRKKTDFMPSFKKTPDVSSTNSAIDETADALKKLLKIGMSPEKNERRTGHQPLLKKSIQQSKQTPVQQPQKKIAKRLVQPLASSSDNVQLDSQLSSVRLLSYYQSKGLGLPRYQFIASENGSVQAQIKLPNRQIIIGQNAENKEEATEFVAKLALQELISKESGLSNQDQGPEKFPCPPKQWYNQDHKKNKEQGELVKGSENKNKERNAWNGMIPLQVVKKEKASSSNSTNQNVVDNSKKDNNENRMSNEKETNSAIENSSTSSKKQQKPRRERKMRIAANFTMKQ